MTRTAAIQWLFGLQAFGVKLGLDNMRRLLGDLGHPQHLYPSILITGSNGKGSVAAMVTAALRARGLRVGTYTSPHLVRLEERIAIDGVPIPRRRTAALAGDLRERITRLMATGELERHPTFFEVVTAMAFVELGRRRVDVAVLEIGLGGRFDATNTAEPVVSVVTAVALEHTRWLGTTLAAIAFEKSGVARSGRPLVTGVAKGPALAVLRARALEVGTTLTVAPREVAVQTLAASRRGLALKITTARGPYPRFRLPLAGRHQAANAAVAVATLEALPERIRPTPHEIAHGLAHTRWQGRLEYLPGRPRLLLDGAHNPHAAAALASYLREFEPGRKVMVFASLGDKDTRAILRRLLPLFEDVVLTRVASPRSRTTGELQALVGRRRRIHEEPDPASALARARALAGPRGLVVATGSLYLVGEVRALAAGEPPPDQG